jgi:uncharacterized membrane protein
MHDREHFFKKNLVTLVLGAIISLSGVGVLLVEQNAYDFSAFEAGTNALKKTITIKENGDVNFVETYQRYLDYQVMFQDIYFTSDNEDISKDIHTPQFDTTRFSNRILDMNQNVFIEGDGTEEVYRQTQFGADMKLSYSWLPNATDELGYPIELEPFDDESVSFFHYKEDYFGDVFIEYDYYINGVALKYADTAEFFWVIASTDGMKTENIDIDIVLPTTSIDLNEVKSYLVGSSQAKVTSTSINDDGHVVINVKADRLFPNEFITARINFPSSALTISPSQNILYGNDVTDVFQGVSHLDNVAKYEQQNATVRFVYTLVDYLGGAIFLAVLFGFVLTMKRIYETFDKEHPTQFYGDYYRELPGDYPPAIMGYLYRFKGIEKDDVTATLMDLVRRKFILLDAGTESLTQEKVNYSMAINKDKDQEELKPFEKQLIKWFFNVVGGGETLSLNQLENYTKKEAQANRYMLENQTFNRLLAQDGATRGFFDSVKQDAKRAAGFLTIVSLVGIGLYIIRLVFALGTFTGILGGVLIGFTIVASGYIANIERRSVQGNEDYVRWHAFKKFLTEFTNIKDYPMPGITIWEHYMVYAISFGVADLVEKQLRFKYTQLNRTDEMNRSAYFRYPGFYRSYYYGVGRSFVNAQQTIAKAQQNNSSRGGGGRFGGGGGFSTGGGGSGVRLR